jgi:membrane-bound acyltransferase YfiQ involved in biofilm formation
LYRRLLQLDGLAILAVVTNHAAGWGIIALFWWTHRYRTVSVPNFDALGTPVYYVTTLLQTLPMFAVPAFLFVSGFFVAYAAQENPQGLSWKAVRVRIVGLMIPYAIWSAVVFLGDFLQGRVYTPGEYFLRLVVFGATGGYAFVPILCSFYALSPILVPWSRTRWKWLLFASALVQLVPMSFRYFKLLGLPIPGLGHLIDWTPDPLFIRWAFFFPLGVVCGVHIHQLGPWLHAHRRLLLGALGMAATLYVAESELIYQATPDHWRQGISGLGFLVYAVAAIMAFLAYRDGPLAGGRWLGQLGTRSYGIYLLQGPVMEAGARLLYHVAPWVLGVQVLFQPILLAMGLAVPLVFMAAVSRSRLRWSYRYLFG